MALTFETKLPREIPAKARVYTLPAPKVSATVLKSIAGGLGLDGAGFDLLTSSDRMGYAGAQSVVLLVFVLVLVALQFFVLRQRH